MKISKKTTLFIILVVFFVTLDSFLKALCLAGRLDAPRPIIGDILSLHYAKNEYIAFSLPFSGPLLTILTGLIILTLLIYLAASLRSATGRQPLDAKVIALTILIVGAILNFTDRLRFGYVVDYFDLKWFTIFNLADIMIVGGVIILLSLNLWSSDLKKHP